MFCGHLERVIKCKTGEGSRMADEEVGAAAGADAQLFFVLAAAQPR